MRATLSQGVCEKILQFKNLCLYGYFCSFTFCKVDLIYSKIFSILKRIQKEKKAKFVSLE